MWFAADEASVLLATAGGSRHVRNLTRDARATVMLHDSRPGIEVCGVSMAGRADIVEGAAAAPLISRVHTRYVTEPGLRLEEVREFLASDDVALRFVPERAITWDERTTEAARALAESYGAHLLVPTSSRHAPGRL